jgi:uncharacterized protein
LGRLVESSVGAHLANADLAGIVKLSYWREEVKEVDFVVKSRRKVAALEVKAAWSRSAFPLWKPFPSRSVQADRRLGSDGKKHRKGSGLLF